MNKNIIISGDIFKMAFIMEKVLRLLENINMLGIFIIIKNMDKASYMIIKIRNIKDDL